MSSNAWPEMLLPEAYQGLARGVVQTIEPHSEADPVAILVDFLVAFGNAAGPSAYIVADGARHPASLFATIVGQTSRSRKGSSRAQVRRVMETADPYWAEELTIGGLSSGQLLRVRSEI